MSTNKAQVAAGMLLIAMMLFISSTFPSSNNHETNLLNEHQITEKSNTVQSLVQNEKTEPPADSLLSSPSPPPSSATTTTPKTDVLPTPYTNIELPKTASPTKFSQKPGFVGYTSTTQPGFTEDFAFMPQDGFDEVGLKVTTRCYAMARFGFPRADGGWNTCMQPPFLDAECKEYDYKCYWKAVGNSKWPPENCVIFSFGSAWNFEYEIALTRLGCKVHTFDPSMPRFKQEQFDVVLRENTGIEFHDIGLGASDTRIGNGWQLKKLKTIMNELNVSRLEILKVDIEGNEWPFLDDFLGSGILEDDAVRQIQLETHYDQGLDTVRMRKIMKGLADYGFKLWAMDENTYCVYVKMNLRPVRGCMELSFVRTRLISPNKK